MTDYKIAQAFDKIQSEIMSEHVIYRPTISKITGSLTSAILLIRIMHYAKLKKNKDFYKFNGSCQHELYREGDSWQEDIGLTRHEFEGARKRIATRVKKGDNKAELMEVFIGDELAPIERTVLYWRDKNNLVWYRFNEDLYKAYLLKLANPEIATSEIRNYLVVPKSGITYGVPKSGITFSTEKLKETNIDTLSAKNADAHPVKESSKKKTSPKERNRIFDGIAFICFGFKETTKLSKQTSARIGKIVKYIKGLEIDVTPEMLWKFSKWYDFQNDGVSRPKDVSKFGEHFELFLQDPDTGNEPQLTVLPRFDVSEDEQTAAIDAFKNKPTFGEAQ